MDEVSARKLDHLVITAFYDVRHEATTLLEEVTLIPKTLPEASLDAVDTSITLFGKRLRAPVIVSGMTGGHEIAKRVNAAIARAVEELGLGMGVGSQRAMLRDPSLVDTYAIARREAPNAVIIANIGAAQLRNLALSDVEKLVEALEADALAVHLNAPQEVFQPEGDRDFTRIVEVIARLVEALDVPIVVKETGHSIDPGSVATLAALGVEYVDVSGAGGTSWVRVEELRARNKGEKMLADGARLYRSWGLPTAIAVAAARWAAPGICVLAGGGVWDGLSALKALALGADAVTIALPVFKAFVEKGFEGVREYLASYVDALRRGMLLIGARSLRDVYTARIMLGERLAHSLEALGVDVRLYDDARRARLYTWRPCGA